MYWNTAVVAQRHPVPIPDNNSRWNNYMHIYRVQVLALEWQTLISFRNAKCSSFYFIARTDTFYDSVVSLFMKHLY